MKAPSSGFLSVAALLFFFKTVLGGAVYLFLFFIIYLAALGLSCATSDLHCCTPALYLQRTGLQHTGLVAPLRVGS